MDTETFRIRMNLGKELSCPAYYFYPYSTISGGEACRSKFGDSDLTLRLHLTCQQLKTNPSDEVAKEQAKGLMFIAENLARQGEDLTAYDREKVNTLLQAYLTAEKRASEIAREAAFHSHRKSGEESKMMPDYLSISNDYMIFPSNLKEKIYSRIPLSINRL